MNDPALQSLGHQVAGALLLEGELGVMVDVLPDLDELFGMGAQRLQRGFSAHEACLWVGRKMVGPFKSPAQ